jgi:alkylated DNA repair dioxygenase AlkB
MTTTPPKLTVFSPPQPIGDSVFIEIPNFLTPDEITYYHSQVEAMSDWKAGDFPSHKSPRLQKWFQDDANYFSKYWKNQDHERWKSHTADEWLVALRDRIQIVMKEVFETQITGKYTGCREPALNSTLVNYYRNGDDYIRYHKDDEKVFGSNPTICMLTFGCPRELKFKWTRSESDWSVPGFAASHHEYDHSYIVEPGTLFVMAGSVQKCFWHGVERDPAITESRYSLTFREHIV